MGMFCYQCQETARNAGCTIRGVCGKSEETANLQDTLIHSLRGLALVSLRGFAKGLDPSIPGRAISEALFATITNANFDSVRIVALIDEAIALRERIAADYSITRPGHSSAELAKNDMAGYLAGASSIGVLATADEDTRSLRELLIYGLKGISAYAHHAAVLGFEDREIYSFLAEALASTTEDLPADKRIAIVLKAGECAGKTMALLDKANTETYGHPRITTVSIGVRNNPGILVSGHDLKDLEELLRQKAGTGVDVYTHSEMLPAHYYPAFTAYPHFAGNYGNAWWKQDREFETFGGPILMTTNCIFPVRDEYRNRIFTTGMAGYPGVRHIPDRKDGKEKDFSALIELAKKCPPPTEIETGTITGGFAHEQVLALGDAIVKAVKNGEIKRFVVMAGCDGRQKGRSYFTELAEGLPESAVILTAGCAKYRYNKLQLGTIAGIPRVLDAGQCNDSYSLAVIALKLKEIFGFSDVNELPISFDLAWYEQKAVAVLLALLSLGFKDIRLGPTLPGFLSPGVAKVLVETFGIRGISDPAADIEAIMNGK